MSLSGLEKRFRPAYLPLLALLIVFLRWPDAILRPQFWAEDGKIYFANAFNAGGFRSLFVPHAGYFQTHATLVAFIASAFPLSAGPFIFNLAAFFIQILPAQLLASARFEGLIPAFSARGLLVLVYLLLPNTAEMQGNMTNAQWFLAILAYLVLVAPEVASRAWDICDSSVLIISGVSGPFSFFLLPPAVVLWIQRRSKRRLLNLVLVAMTAAIQAMALLATAGRLVMFPVRHLDLVLPILGRQVVWGVLIGAHGFEWLSAQGWFASSLAGSTVAAVAIAAYSFIKAPLELKLFLLFSGLTLAASILSPTGDFSMLSPMESLRDNNTGNRYWLIPMCAFLITLAWSVMRAQSRVVRGLSAAFLMTMVVGIVIDFRHPPLVDYQFSEQVRRFEALPPGGTLTIPINPPTWTMELVRR